METIIVGDNINNRLDAFLSEILKDFSRERIKKHILSGKITVNNKRVRPNYPVKLDDKISIDPLFFRENSLKAQQLPLEIIYQDDDISIINKKKGLITHPASINQKNTLANALLYHMPMLADTGSSLRPGIVHRLDKDTSGIMIIALTDLAYQDLSRQFKEKTVEKEYLAIAKGEINLLQWEVNLPLLYNPSKMKGEINQSGKEAITKFELITPLNGYSLIKCQPITGRTHQIRLHLLAMGHPIMGDILYNPRANNEKFCAGQMLHAHKIALNHPKDGKKINFTANIPPEFAEILKNLEI